MRVCSVFGEISDKLHKCFVLWSYDLIKLCMHMWEDAVSCMQLLMYSLAWKLGEVLGKTKSDTYKTCHCCRMGRSFVNRKWYQWGSCAIPIFVKSMHSLVMLGLWTSWCKMQVRQYTLSLSLFHTHTLCHFLLPTVWGRRVEEQHKPCLQ